MSFLRIGALWALPLVLVPIVIHLIHRRKHPTMQWAAMMFIHRAAQSRRGPAKLRRWLILATRVLVVAAVVFALARPLSSGAFGVAASRVANGATSIVVLDRSPSMQRRLDSGITRQQAGLQGIARTLQTLGSQHVVLIDGLSDNPLELSGANALLTQDVTAAVDSTTDIPSLMRDALRYLVDNDQRVADVWVCSDLQSSDWMPDSKTWNSVESDAANFGSGLRFHLLEFTQDDQVNSSVSISGVHWDIQSDQQTGQGRAVALSVDVARDDDIETVVPVRVSVGGVTSSVEVSVKKGHGQASNLQFPIDDDLKTVWGQVAIAADVNASDDHSFFVLTEDSQRPIGLVAEQRSVALEVASDVVGQSVGLSRTLDSQTEQGAGRVPGSQSKQGLGSDREFACVAWQGELPTGEDADRVTQYLEQGGAVVFFPPSVVDHKARFHGVGWGNWQRDSVSELTFESWPFAVDASCSIDGDVVQVAATKERTVIGRISIGKGTAWFCGCDVTDPDDAFVADGLVLYGLFSRALETSLLGRPDGLPMIAGEVSGAWADGRRYDQTSRLLPDVNASQPAVRFGNHVGVYSISDEAQDVKRLVAINRPLAESSSPPLSNDQLADLAGGIRWNRVSVAATNLQSDRGFVREVWGAVWALAIIGMLAEAWLSLPNRSRGTAT